MKSKFQEGDLIKHIKDPSGDIYIVVEVIVRPTTEIIYVIENNMTMERMILQNSPIISGGWKKA